MSRRARNIFVGCKSSSRLGFSTPIGHRYVSRSTPRRPRESPCHPLLLPRIGEWGSFAKVYAPDTARIDAWISPVNCADVVVCNYADSPPGRCRSVSPSDSVEIKSASASDGGGRRRLSRCEKFKDRKSSCRLIDKNENTSFRLA